MKWGPGGAERYRPRNYGKGCRDAHHGTASRGKQLMAGSRNHALGLIGGLVGARGPLRRRRISPAWRAHRGLVERAPAVGLAEPTARRRAGRGELGVAGRPRPGAVGRADSRGVASMWRTVTLPGAGRAASVVTAPAGSRRTTTTSSTTRRAGGSAAPARCCRPATEADGPRRSRLADHGGFATGRTTARPSTWSGLGGRRHDDAAADEQRVARRPSAEAAACTPPVGPGAPGTGRGRARG